jgi:hypothetical protein
MRSLQRNNVLPATTDLSRWFFFEQPNFIARDQMARVSATYGELTIDIPRYTLTRTGINDHPKVLMYISALNKETGFPGFKVPEEGEFYYGAKIKVQTFGTEKNPFNAPASDFRLSSGGLVTIDFDTFMVYDFLITPTKAYVLYERLPFDGKVKDPVAFFTYVLPVSEIQQGTKHNYKLSYNMSKYQVHYYIDGKRVFTVNEFGRRLPKDYDDFLQFKDLPGSGNPENLQLVKSNQRLTGIGLFTMLDGRMRYGGELVNIHDPTLEPAKKVFGQGGKIVVSDIVVGTR